MLQQLLGKVNDFKPIGFSEGTGSTTRVSGGSLFNDR
jgi:hypothetical protein